MQGIKSSQQRRARERKRAVKTEAETTHLAAMRAEDLLMNIGKYAPLHGARHPRLTEIVSERLMDIMGVESSRVRLDRIFFALCVPLPCAYCGHFRNIGEGLPAGCACTFYKVNGFVKKFFAKDLHNCGVCGKRRFYKGVLTSCTCVSICRDAVKAAGWAFGGNILFQFFAQFIIFAHRMIIFDRPCLELHVLGDHLRLVNGGGQSGHHDDAWCSLGWHQVQPKCGCRMSITPAESTAARKWQTANLLPFASEFGTCVDTSRDEAPAYGDYADQRLILPPNHCQASLRWHANINKKK